MFGTDRSIRLIFKSRFNGSLLPFEEMEESWFISETWYIAKWLNSSFEPKAPPLTG
jgi:hypothetical protein